MIPDAAVHGPVLDEAMRELEAAIHDARVAFDCIDLGEIDRAHTSAVTARAAIDAAVTACGDRHAGRSGPGPRRGTRLRICARERGPLIRGNDRPRQFHSMSEDRACGKRGDAADS